MFSQGRHVAAKAARRPFRRWGAELGVWLTVLAVTLNVLGNALYAPVFAADDGTEWIQICTGSGLQTIAVDLDDQDQPAGGSYCPACPLCPSPGGLGWHLPALPAESSVVPPVRVTGRASPAQAAPVGQAQACVLPALSRAPPPRA